MTATMLRFWQFRTRIVSLSHTPERCGSSACECEATQSEIGFVIEARKGYQGLARGEPIELIELSMADAKAGSVNHMLAPLGAAMSQACVAQTLREASNSSGESD